jgi:DNA-binding transcriptional LysR family regulator
MDTIPGRNEADLDFHQLQVFDVLLTERSITKAARVLNLTQPALSKTLARMRTYFGDPLFIRVSLRMEPTPKALELAEPVRAILERVRTLRTEHSWFDPKTSERTFRFFLLDAGIVMILPALLNHLRTEAPGVQIQAVQCDAQHLDLWLESGLLDVAIGSFPALGTGIRRVPLWTESYVSVTRKDHPRLGPTPSKEVFINERHALVSAVGTGHEHLTAERLIEASVPQKNIVCRVPTFTSAGLIAKHSDTVVTMPRTFALAIAADLDLQLVEPPLAFPRIEIAQYWHDRVHREPGNQWIRSVLQKLFRKLDPTAACKPQPSQM